jgi:hypothetical protein
VICTAVEVAWAMQVLVSIPRGLDCLLRNNQYLHLEEVRCNRFVRAYHGQTGKMSLAHDERLELNNKEFAMYPSVRTLEGISCELSGTINRPYPEGETGC